MATHEQLKMRCSHNHTYLDYNREVVVHKTCPLYERAAGDAPGRTRCTHGEYRDGRLDLCGLYCLLDEKPEEIVHERPATENDHRVEVVILHGPRQRPIG